jgi:xanthine/uracil/vitamin C permease (AzgA family)
MDDKTTDIFDLRRIIGGMFTVLGLLLVVLGLFDSQEEIDKAAGVNINLWAGLGMLVVGLLFLLWAFTRPLSEQVDPVEPPADAADEPRRVE